MTDRQIWLSLCFRLGIRNNPEHEYMEIDEAHSAPGRSYHNMDHVRHCLQELRDFRQVAKPIEEIEMAIWFHDIVYDSHEKDNEKKSAAFAKKILSSIGMREPFIKAVSSLIMITAHKKTPEDMHQKIMVDVDLSILGQEEDAFDLYESQIREEYSWVLDKDFNAERAKVLQRFLDRPSVYLTAIFLDKYEEKARENIQRSISNLSTS